MRVAQADRSRPRRVAADRAGKLRARSPAVTPCFAQADEQARPDLPSAASTPSAAGRTHRCVSRFVAARPSSRACRSCHGAAAIRSRLRRRALCALAALRVPLWPRRRPRRPRLHARGLGLGPRPRTRASLQYIRSCACPSSSRDRHGCESAGWLPRRPAGSKVGSCALARLGCDHGLGRDKGRVLRDGLGVAAIAATLEPVTAIGDDRRGRGGFTRTLFAALTLLATGPGSVRISASPHPGMRTSPLSRTRASPPVGTRASPLMERRWWGRAGCAGIRDAGSLSRASRRSRCGRGHAGSDPPQSRSRSKRPPRSPPPRSPRSRSAALAMRPSRPQRGFTTIASRGFTTFAGFASSTFAASRSSRPRGLRGGSRPSRASRVHDRYELREDLHPRAFARTFTTPRPFSRGPSRPSRPSRSPKRSRSSRSPPARALAITIEPARPLASSRRAALFAITRFAARGAGGRSSC